MTDVPGPDPVPHDDGAGIGDVVRPGTGQDVSPADQRAGLRLGLAVLGAGLLAAVLGPVALLVRGQWAPLVAADERVSAAAERAVSGSPLLLGAARTLTHLGDPVLVTVAVVVAVGVLLRAGRRRAALFLLVARLGSLLLSQGTKAAVDRARPVFEEPVSSALGASFPSGHALGGSVFWLSLAVVLLPLVAPARRRLLLPAAATIGVVVAATRVLLGVHYLVDVVAGLLLGVAWTVVCASIFVVWRTEEGRPVDVLTDGLDPEAGADR